MMKRQSTLFPEKEEVILPELTLEEAEVLANQIRNAVEAHCERIEIAGSMRRQKPIVHDIDFVVLAKNNTEWKKINEELRRLRAKPCCSGNSLTKAYLPCNNEFFQVDFYRAKPETFGIHLLIRTGSAEHNCWLAGYAISKGMRLKYSEGLSRDGNPIAGADEKGVFEALNLPFPQPNQREIVNNKPTWITFQEQQQ